MDKVDTRHRKAPYAPISALHEFFARIKNIGVPSVVDRKFIQKLNIASNNEWALLSSLKFLGIIDERGEPTSAYRSLQSTDRFGETLRHLVETAYADLLDTAGTSMSTEELENYFRVTSSPSQAKNAARFFREVSHLAGLGETTLAVAERPDSVAAVPQAPNQFLANDDTRKTLLQAKARLLEKLPEPRPEWSATEYDAICQHFLEMLKHLGECEDL